MISTNLAAVTNQTPCTAHVHMLPCSSTEVSVGERAFDDDRQQDKTFCRTYIEAKEQRKSARSKKTGVIAVDLLN